MKLCNFDVHCTVDEAYELMGHSYIHIFPIVKECFYNAFHNESRNKNSDYKWCDYSALASVFIMGYTSGVRAEREKKRLKK